MTDIPSAYESVPSITTAGTAPPCSTCGRPINSTPWLSINNQPIHEGCLSTAAIAGAVAKEEITRLRSELSARDKRIEELEGALKALSAMYSETWDSVDGALVMMGSGVDRFEAAHAAAYAVLSQSKGDET